MTTILSPSKISEVFKRLAEEYPDPETALDYSTHFQLLVAVVLSAQTTDKAVNQVTPALFMDAPDAEAMAEYGEANIAERIKRLGLFRNKAKHVHKLAEKLVAEFNGEVPETREGLQSLPGVGRKTASVVLNVAFGHPTVAVDTHVFRLANRIGLAQVKTPDQVERVLEKIIPEAYIHDAHHHLIYHGRQVCHARRPQCESCVLFDICSRSI